MIPRVGTPSDTPLRQLVLKQWSTDDVLQALADSALLLQLQRPDAAERPGERRIIVFVHGLNSGPKAWLGFLVEAFVVPELQAFDLALFNYQTSVFGRFVPFQRLPRVEDWARVLAKTIRATLLDQERYDSFVLVGHSMGGLVAKFAYKYLVETDAPAAARLHSLFTYGTPNHGSDRVTAWAALVSPDLAFLRAFSDPIHDLQTFWNTRVSAVPAAPGKLTVHERAIVSVKDYWVAPASGVSALPENFVLRLASSHSTLIKPTGSRDPRLAWFVEQLQAIERPSEASLIEIRNGPGLDVFAGAAEEEGGEEAGLKFLTELFQALFVLDAGTADGIAVGDKFELYYDATEVRDRTGRVIDRIPGASHSLTVVEVRERTAYCKMKDFAYEPAFASLQHAIDELPQGPDDSIDQAQLEKLVLSLFGRRARRIRREEFVVAAEALENAYGRVLDEPRKSPARSKALLELLSASREYLQKFPDSATTEKAAFHVAWSSMELGRYEEAESLFDRFCEKYPFSVSVEGARDWIEEIRHRVQLRDSHDAPEQQWRLAEYLLDRDLGSDEGAELALAAYCAKPELLARMKPPVRFIITGRYILHDVLGMDLEMPDAMAALLSNYKTDQQARQQTRNAIDAKVAPDRAKLLLQLLDATSADWKDKAEAKDRA
jgi:pimeloyl-ACP methyl ester carboxylesterase